MSAPALHTTSGEAQTMTHAQSHEPAKAGDANRPATSSSLRKWAPLAVIAALMALSFAMGWHKYLSFKTIGLNYEALQTFIEEYFIAALALYILTYIVVVALSLPGGLVMTLSGGLLFGWQVGAAATVVGATIGATLIFLVAKTSFGETLAAKAGPWIGKLRDGFQDNALSYLLFLRLVPAFPFFVVNLAPALLGVPLRTYRCRHRARHHSRHHGFLLRRRRPRLGGGGPERHLQRLPQGQRRQRRSLPLHHRHQRARHQGAPDRIRPARCRRPHPRRS